jgi:hypothetical protein
MLKHSGRDLIPSSILPSHCFLGLRARPPSFSTSLRNVFERRQPLITFFFPNERRPLPPKSCRRSPRTARCAPETPS